MALYFDLFSIYLHIFSNCIQFHDFNYWLYIDDFQIYIFSPHLSHEFQTHILLPTRYLHKLGGLNNRYLFSQSSRS